MRVLIADDELFGRNNLKILLAEYVPSITTILEASTLEQTKKTLISENPDILFLDMNFPEGNGLSVLSNLPEGVDPYVIVVTAYDKYAIEAFQYSAQGYLLKPLDRVELINAVNKAQKAIHKSDHTENSTLNQSNGILSISVASGLLFRNTEDIIFLKADKNYTEIVFEDETIIASKNIKHFENILPKISFIESIMDT